MRIAAPPRARRPERSRDASFSAQALLVARVHALRKPLGRQVARDLRALQADVRHERARNGLAAHLVRQLEHTTTELRFREILIATALGRISSASKAAKMSCAQARGLFVPCGSSFWMLERATSGSIGGSRVRAPPHPYDTSAASSDANQADGPRYEYNACMDPLSYEFLMTSEVANSAKVGPAAIGSRLTETPWR